MTPLAIAAAASVAALAEIEHFIKVAETPARTLLYRPTRKNEVVIVIPALNEEAYIEDCLKSLLSQCWLRRFRDVTKIVLADAHSEDRTVEIAERYVDEVVEVPVGKLRALDIVYREEEDAEILVTVDADVTFAKQHLNFLLRHFNVPETVATAGLTLDIKDETNAGTDIPTWNIYRTYAVPAALTMLGSNRAVRRWAYLESPFRLADVDESDVLSVLLEEQVSFPARLSRLGGVVGEPYAIAYHSTRRLQCELGIVGNEAVAKYCADIAAGKRF